MKSRDRSWVPSVTIGVTALAILTVLNPWLRIDSTTPSGGVMGAHVLGPAFLRDVLIPEGRLMGWSNSWFAGFPAFYFYFPLPSIVIVLLDVVLPYGVAFKVVSVLGLVGMAPAAFFLARSLGFSRSIASVAAAAMAPFVFMESYSIYGGNVASTLAGEFAYSWSFALGLVYLGLLMKSIKEDPKYVPWAAAALAATVLSHVLTTMVLVVASLTVLTWKNSFRIATRIWFWGFLISAFWTVPLVARINLTSDMAWTPLSRWEEVFPVELWLLLPIAVVGSIWAVRRTARILPIMTATLVPVIYYPMPLVLNSYFPGVFPERWKLWNGRLLPYWYFGVTFLAAIGVGALVMVLSRRLPHKISGWWPRGVALLVGIAAVGLLSVVAAPDWIPLAVAALFLVGISISLRWLEPVTARAVLTATAAAAFLVGGIGGVTFVDGWAKWNYEGYEAKAPWPEYEALMETVDTLPPGRIQWEANNDLNKYGTPMALMLFPYWSEGHPSMEGLFFESSLTTPFHFLNAGEMSFRPSNPIPGLRYQTFSFDRGLSHLDLYGVRYYVSFTPEATQEARNHPELTEVAESPPFTVFELPPSELVVPVAYQPAVFRPELAEDGIEPPPSFHDFALDWYDDVTLLDRPVVEDGPEDWPSVSIAAGVPELRLGTGGEVSDIEVDDHRIAFKTTAVGVPHVVKVSYFPNWKASGAEGPFRVTPSVMLVVPTSEEVVLEFKNTWAERLGILGSIVGFGAFLALRRKRATDGEEAPHGSRDPLEQR